MLAFNYAICILSKTSLSQCEDSGPHAYAHTSQAQRTRRTEVRGLWCDGTSRNRSEQTWFSESIFRTVPKVPDDK